MNNARVEQVGEPQNVYDQPKSPFVIEFLGNVNRFAAGVGAAPTKNRDLLYVRPHDVDKSSRMAATDTRFPRASSMSSRPAVPVGSLSSG